MGATTKHAITSNTPNRIEVDAGAVYLDWGESGEVLLGACRGGSRFEVNETQRQAEVDGIGFGSIKGLKRSINLIVTLKVTLVEWSLAQLTRMCRGTSTSDGTYRLITPSTGLATTDYLTNVALVGSVMNTDTPVVIMLLNPIESGPWTISTADEDEGQMEVNFEAHYDTAAMTTVPYTIRWPVGAS